ncbi:uncharacterized protein PV07_02735 [Cladophialophora immunda]|uniref:L-ornithine N(5)-oxygenase n=1 Tax=Cladophialophora immunda TaxID=569365 RepID=A0A0D2B0H9_9EURO|nr:uncharacterized protein PV07_02735 [Cladophialophora immunda]KIW31052.1 hypothetical protein PV07_02735 [Cladophialophora immunda]OQV05924.1 hypothetical protein CLAIMM_10578 [Cladophialophora immunda]
MAHGEPQKVDTVIVGNGPSALILSYILHGHIPYYDKSSPHPDAILHEKLLGLDHDLLDIDFDYLTEHFAGSRFSYSTQALPVNVLLDTLVRPLGETDDAEKKTCVRWAYEPSRAVTHTVIGQAHSAGGQWVENPVRASWDIGTLSYAGMISLPGYGFDEHYQRRNGRPMPVYLRPSRHAVADYLADYPYRVGIADSIRNGEHAGGIARRGDGFYVASHNILCKNLVLASGIFSELIQPRPLLRPLVELLAKQMGPSPNPLLVIGSGFSAADVIISSPPNQKIIHIYKWAPSTSPSPLRACHQQAYPEYAGVYRRMKLAANSSLKLKDKRPRYRRVMTDFDLSRDWNTTYEGFPNTEVIGVQITDDGSAATVTLQNASKNEPPFQRQVSGLEYVVGRRGSLDYLSTALLREVMPKEADAQPAAGAAVISAQTLREKANEDLELAPHVFITGSLTGDSLIRFAYGGCAYAAGRIMRADSQNGNNKDELSKPRSNGAVKVCLGQYQTPTSSPKIPAMNGLDGHESSPVSLAERTHMSLDRRKE